MRRSILAVLVLTACTGGTTANDYSYPSTYDDGGGDVAPPPGGTGDDEVDCNQVPNLEPEDQDTCDDLSNGLDDILDAATECIDKSDCQVFSVPCEGWDDAPGCFAIVNTCVTQQQINSWHPDENGIEGCDTFVPGYPDTDCQCGAAPLYDCVNGVCDEVFNQP